MLLFLTLSGLTFYQLSWPLDTIVKWLSSPLLWHLFSYSQHYLGKNNPSFKQPNPLLSIYLINSQSILIRQSCVKKEPGDKDDCVRSLVVPSYSHVFCNIYLPELKSVKSTAVAELTKMKQTLITLMNAIWNSTRNWQGFMTHSLLKSSKTWKEAQQFKLLQISVI